MGFEKLVEAVKGRLAPKRKMSTTEAQEANKKASITAGNEYKTQGIMPKVSFAEAGVTPASDEYMTDRAMRNESTKRLEKEMTLKKFSEGK